MPPNLNCKGSASIFSFFQAELCEVAEKTSMKAGTTDEIVYVIGTEIPLPGGAAVEEDEHHVTLVEDVQATIESTQNAFFSLAIEKAWQRVIAVVVQPGVEFGDNVIFNY
jgi:D-tagatose-1,6-bisphosphate aldolase subunit GatZ/KbaZ